MNEIARWCNKEGMNLKGTAIQSKTNCGRASYSTNQMLTEVLMSRISRIISRTVATRWQVIAMGTRANQNEGKLQKTNDIWDFKCDARDALAVVPRL